MTQRFSRRESATNCDGAGWVIVKLIGIDPDDRNTPLYDVTITDARGSILFHEIHGESRHPRTGIRLPN